MDGWDGRTVDEHCNSKKFVLETEDLIWYDDLERNQMHPSATVGNDEVVTLVHSGQISLKIGSLRR